MYIGELAQIKVKNGEWLIGVWSSDSLARNVKFNLSVDWHLMDKQQTASMRNPTFLSCTSIITRNLFFDSNMLQGRCRIERLANCCTIRRHRWLFFTRPTTFVMISVDTSIKSPWICFVARTFRQQKSSSLFLRLKRREISNFSFSERHKSPERQRNKEKV